MNWEAFGAIAEMAGALSVLATLVYLARQIKDNSKLLSTTIQDSAMEGYNIVNQWAVGDEELAKLTYRMFSGDDSGLSDLERFRLDFILRIYANHIYKLYRLYADGVYSEKQWQNSGLEAKEVYSSSALGREFMRNNHLFDDLWVAFDTLEDRPMSKILT